MSYVLPGDSKSEITEKGDPPTQSLRINLVPGTEKSCVEQERGVQLNSVGNLDTLK